MTARNQRVAEEMKKEIARIIRDEVKDPRLEAGLVSVTGVELSNDRHYAKVYVSIYGDEEARTRPWRVWPGLPALSGGRSASA